MQQVYRYQFILPYKCHFDDTLEMDLSRLHLERQQNVYSDGGVPISPGLSKTVTGLFLIIMIRV